MADQNVACCAHLHVAYHTEDVKHDFGPLIQDAPNDGVHVPPHGVQTVTRGWWACRDCGKRFVPAGVVPSRPARDGETLSDERAAEIVNAAKRYSGEWGDWATLAHCARFLDSLDDLYLSHRALMARDSALRADLADARADLRRIRNYAEGNDLPALRNILRVAARAASGEDASHD